MWSFGAQQYYECSDLVSDVSIARAVSVGTSDRACSISSLKVIEVDQNRNTELS